MASEVDVLVSTGATLAVGSAIMFDSVNVGGSTGKVEVIKLADGTAGSTTLVPMSSAALGGPGLQVFVVNSSANPVGVSIAAGQSTVTGSGVFHIDDNAGSLTIDINNAAVSSANPIPVQLVSTSATPGPVMISSAAPASTDLGLAVRQVGFVAYSTNVTISAAIPQSSVSVASLPNLSTGSIIRIDTVAGTVTITGTVTANVAGNTTASVVLTTASKSQVEIINTGIGGSTTNPIFVVSIPQISAGNSTWSNPAKLTSTALTALFSSAASTRFNMTDLTVTNKGATATLFRVFDGSSGGTLLYQVWCASAGGGAAPTFPVPRSGSSGAVLNCKILPASTVYVSAGAFRSA